MTISFKTAAREVATIHNRAYKIVCFKDTTGGRLRVDAATTSRGKQDPAKQGQRSMLVYRSHMYTEASLDPERCSLKSVQKARNHWVVNQVRQLGHFEDVSSPEIITHDEDMEDWRRKTHNGHMPRGSPREEGRSSPKRQRSTKYKGHSSGNNSSRHDNNGSDKSYGCHPQTVRHSKTADNPHQGRRRHRGRQP